MNTFDFEMRKNSVIMTILVLILSARCAPQAHAPREGTTRTEDVSQVIYNHSWLKANVPLRNLKVDRLNGNLLHVVAQLHSEEPHVSRRVNVRTEFYAPAMADGGVVVDKTEWTEFVLEPRKRVQYEVSSLKPADDFRIYVYYDEDIGKP
ncbi:MAG TPA: hypothetical protein VJZ71_20440 [Phycisphaerae bacterium]|nr:hypothetical protein [Phycisphaerae bacterium]